MSTIKSSAENLTLNADGANNDVLIQSNGSTKVTVDGATGNVGLGVASAYNPASGRKALTVEGTSTALIEMAVNGARKGYIYHNATNLYLATEVSGGNVILAPHDSGDVNITNSDIIFDTAGKGIVLGATSNVDANTLSDYEQGSWTPVWAPTTSGSITTNTTYSGGVYTKIGNLVTVFGRLYTSSVSSPAGKILISGLPFTIKSGPYTAPNVSFPIRGLSSNLAGVPLGTLLGNTTTLQVADHVWGTSEGGANFADKFDNDVWSTFTFTYQA